MRTLSLFFLVGVIILTQQSNAQQPASLPPSQLLLPVSDVSIEFVWKGDSILGKWNPHTALLIPVRLPNCSKEFYMQFDLGSPVSMFYENQLLQIAKQYPKAVELNDSTALLKDFKFKTGETLIAAKEILLLQQAGSTLDWSKKSIEIIGTLGADLIDNKVLTIDYPCKMILLSDTILPKFSSAVSGQFLWAGRRVLIPSTIKSTKTFLLFDTGASMFELITDQETALSLSVTGAVANRYEVHSWNRTMTANTLPSADSIEVGSQKLPLQNITWFQGASEEQISQMKKMGMGGMIGNKLFINSILVLDTRSKKFGVIHVK